MSARKTRLTEYEGEVFAAKITDIQPREMPGIPGICMTLTFGELGKRAILIPSWVEENKPAVGGFFVVKDGPNGSIATFKPAVAFNRDHKKVKDKPRDKER